MTAALQGDASALGSFPNLPSSDTPSPAVVDHAHLSDILRGPPLDVLSRLQGVSGVSGVGISQAPPDPVYPVVSRSPHLSSPPAVCPARPPLSPPGVLSGPVAPASVNARDDFFGRSAPGDAGMYTSSASGLCTECPL